MIRPKLAQKEVSTPLGIKVMLRSLSYGDSKAINAEAFGDTPIGTDVKITMAQAQEMMTLTVLKAMVSWDVTEEDGSKTPINKETIEEIFTDEDFAFLVGEIKPSKKK